MHIQGVEFQSPTSWGSIHGDFFRYVRCGRKVVTRSGKRGTPGDQRTRRFDDARSAQEFVVKRRRRHMEQQGYDEAYDTGPINVDVAPTDPERTFLDAWATQVRLDVSPLRATAPDGPTQRLLWVAFTGLCAERDFHHGAATLYDHLVAGPHLIDDDTDTIVAQASRVPTYRGVFGVRAADASLMSVGYGVLGYPLGPVTPWCPHNTQACTSCTSRTTELLVFLTRGVDLAATDDNHRRQMASTAHRLLLRGHSGVPTQAPPPPPPTLPAPPASPPPAPSTSSPPAPAPVRH